DEGVVAETCSTPGTAAFRLRALAEHPGARAAMDCATGCLAIRQRREHAADRIIEIKRLPIMRQPQSHDHDIARGNDHDRLTLKPTGLKRICGRARKPS